MNIDESAVQHRSAARRSHLLVSGLIRGAGFIRFRTSPPSTYSIDPFVPRTVKRNAAAPASSCSWRTGARPVHVQYGPGLSVLIHELEPRGLDRHRLRARRHHGRHRAHLRHECTRRKDEDRRAPDAKHPRLPPFESIEPELQLIDDHVGLRLV